METPNTTTAIQKKHPGLEELEAMLQNRKSVIAQVIPKFMTPERLVKVGLMAYGRSKDLKECTVKSVCASIIQAAELGLEPGGALGHCYLVPYRSNGQKVAQLIIGYRGMIDLARRSGQIESITAHVVHANDEFEIDYGEEKLTHRPHLGTEPGPMVAVWARARIQGGGVQTVIMTKKEVDDIRNRSKASGSGPWQTDYEEMAKKTVIRRLFKMLPVSIEMAKATALESYRAGEAPDVGGVFDTDEANQNVPADDENTVNGEIVTNPSDPGEDYDPETGVVNEQPQKEQAQKVSESERKILDNVTKAISAAAANRDMDALKKCLPALKELHGQAHSAAKAHYSKCKEEIEKANGSHANS